MVNWVHQTHGHATIPEISFLLDCTTQYLTSIPCMSSPSRNEKHFTIFMRHIAISKHATLRHWNMNFQILRSESFPLIYNFVELAAFVYKALNKISKIYDTIRKWPIALVIHDINCLLNVQTNINQLNLMHCFINYHRTLYNLHCPKHSVRVVSKK